jgi:putative NIF3 family GTP cyclohydrolase 1 type 2
VRLREMYELAVQMGIDADPRGRSAVEKLLEKTRKKYEKLDGDEKEEFDLEQLSNPYSDTRISFGADDIEVSRVLVGIDVDQSEILMAKELERQGTKIDLVLSHHPAGKARVKFADVMCVQADMLAQAGVPINVAEAILEGRMNQVDRMQLPANHYRVVDAARLLNVPLMSIHTPADNHAQQIVQKHLDEQKPETLEDVIKALKEMPEYKQAAKMGMGPRILVGKKEGRAGKTMVIMTGGTGGPTEDIQELVKAGVGTIVLMHLSEEKKKEAEKHHLNVIIAGHMASDSVGMNAILDEFEKRGIEIVPCSGIIRVSRVAGC